jgi:hypothetical protein
MQRNMNNRSKKALRASPLLNSRGHSNDARSTPQKFALKSRDQESSKSFSFSPNSFESKSSSFITTSIPLNHSSADALGRNPGFISRCWSTQSLYYLQDMPTGPPQIIHQKSDQIICLK